MFNNNGKFFRQFTARELFTEYLLSLMKDKKTFMVFSDNNQVLIDEEVDEWLKVNGVTNPTERLLYRPIKYGYTVHYSKAITNVMIPYEEIAMDYEDFIDQAEKDMGWKE